MCEICENRVRVRMYGGAADGDLALVDRRLQSVELPEVLTGGRYVYTWAKGPVGSADEGKDVLVCPGVMPIRG